MAKREVQKMGCDIHLTVEQEVGGRWTLLHKTPWGRKAFPEVYWTDSRGFKHSWPNARYFNSRNYPLFAFLAQVRGNDPDGFRPRDLPVDSPCRYVTRPKMDLGDHSFSHLYLEELLDALPRRIVKAMALSDDPEERWGLEGFREFHALLVKLSKFRKEGLIRLVFGFDS